jgi:hypothetical protein
MKKNISFILIIFILSGCSKKFLAVYPDTVLSEGSYYTSESDFIALANGCYLPLRDYIKNDAWVIAELISDNGSKQYNTSTGEALKGVVDQFITTAENAHYASFWNLAYNGINRCNKLLLEIDQHNVTWSNTALKDRCQGEALFLRSLYYFELVRQFGGVPLVLKTITANEAVATRRAPEDDIYASIISDLQQSLTHFNLADNVRENGRANLGASNALLAKVYITKQRFSDAKPVLESVINSGRYILLPNYANLFDPTNKDFKETIFSVQYSESTPALANNFIFQFAPWNSGGVITNRPAQNLVNTGGYNIPTQDLLDAFETGDLRRDVSIKFWNGVDWDGVVRPLPYCAKYKPPVTALDNSCSDNFPLLRYSDVLLMYAESLNNMGTIGTAITYVQQVRNRAGLTNDLTGYDKTKLDSLIAKERQKEFCFENQRWYDLKRTGQAIIIMNQHGIKMKARYPFLPANSYLVTPNKLVGPIPSQQIVLNKIDQNAGY